MNTNISMEEFNKIINNLKDKGYDIHINGSNQTIEIILKTVFEQEILNRINEIKSIILQERNIKNLNNFIEVKNTKYYNKIKKVIEIKL